MLKSIFTLVVSLLWGSAYAQFPRWLGTTNDTSYVNDYSKDLTVRLNVTRRYFSYRLADENVQQHLNYKPNTPLNVGAGFNYKFLGLNFGYNLPTLGDNSKYGKTHVIDLSLHVYLRKFLVELYGMSYNGLYLANTNVLASLPASNNYVRQDLHIRNAGLSVDYVFNPSKYSFRAAFLQNEHQKKSSGSFLVGADVHANYVRSDSSVVPAEMVYPGFFEGNDFNRVKSYSFSVNAGYAYTFVLKTHLFFLMGFQAGGGLNYTILKETETHYKADKLGPTYQATLRLAVGYNSRTYFAGIHYTGVSLYNVTPYSEAVQRFGMDNIRFSIARRFVLKKPLIGRF